MDTTKDCISQNGFKYLTIALFAKVPEHQWSKRKNV